MTHHGLLLIHGANPTILWELSKWSECFHLVVGVKPDGRISNGEFELPFSVTRGGRVPVALFAPPGLPADGVGAQGGKQVPVEPGGRFVRFETKGEFHPG